MVFFLYGFVSQQEALSTTWLNCQLKSERPSAPAAELLPHAISSCFLNLPQPEEKMSVRIKEVVPSAPPLDLMDDVPGYEGTSYDAVTTPPPSTFTSPLEGSVPVREALPRNPGISEEEAREALLQHVQKNCCYGRSAARDLVITKINYSSAFHYKLETFTEKRQTAWFCEPYTGEMIETIESGTPPLPWEVEVEPAEKFTVNSKHLEIPHTASVKPCHTCKAVGNTMCVPCAGQGVIRCVHCHGDGTKPSTSGERETCFFCHGLGKEKCSTCSSTGKVPCKQCNGKSQLKCYIKLTVSWNNNVLEHVVERTNLPEYLVKRVSGQVVFEEECPRVWPINHFPDTTINMASVQLVQQHSSAFPEEKVLLQRQQVRLVPVTEIFYRWKRHEGRFYVYGFENKVHAPDYPQKQLWGCHLL